MTNNKNYVQFYNFIEKLVKLVDDHKLDHLQTSEITITKSNHKVIDVLKDKKKKAVEKGLLIASFDEDEDDL